MFRLTSLMIKVLLMISFLLSRIYAEKVSSSRIFFENIEKKYCNKLENDDQIIGTPNEINEIFLTTYDNYMRLRKEDGQFNQNLGENKELFDILMEYQKSTTEYLNKLIEVYTKLTKLSLFYYGCVILFNLIILGYSLFTRFIYQFRTNSNEL